MNKYITSLKLSKQLKKAGVEQVSEYYWIFPQNRLIHTEAIHGLYIQLDIEITKKYSAFLTDELLKKLPQRRCGGHIFCYKNKYSYEVCYKKGSAGLTERHAKDRFLPNACAKMLLWLKEHGEL